jgi:branched-chain amino acid transport system substrate-binding protein
MSIDSGTGEVIHDIYMRKVEKVNSELQNVEFATFDAVKDTRTAAQ